MESPGDSPARPARRGVASAIRTRLIVPRRNARRCRAHLDPPAPPSVTSTLRGRSNEHPHASDVLLASVVCRPKVQQSDCAKGCKLISGYNMTTITDMVARGWENFVARPRGPLNLRFIIQPTLASIIALRAGLKDANAGRPAYLWAVLTNSGYRERFLHGGLKDLRSPGVVGPTLDVVYQIIIHRWIYPLELLFTVTLLVLVPYLILRGPVNRIASRFVSGGGADAAGKNSGQQSKTIT